MVAQRALAETGEALTLRAIESFNARGGAYDKGCSAVNWKGPDYVVKGLQAYIDLQRQGQALDLGAGTGLVGACLKKINPDIHVVGVEPAQSMLDKAVETGRVDTPILARIKDTKSQCSGKFKIVTCVGVADFLHDPSEVEWLANVTADKLHQDGVFAVTFEPLGTQFPGSGNAQHDPEKLKALFHAHGLRVVGEERVFLYESFEDRKANKEKGIEQPPVENVVFIGTVDHHELIA